MKAVLSESNDEDDDETIQRDNKEKGNQFLSHNNRKNLRVNDNIISLN